MNNHDLLCPSASYTMLGIENGIVCYSGIDIGSTAIYYCLKCGYQEIMTPESLIRRCNESGQWEGTVPMCECSK